MADKRPPTLDAGTDWPRVDPALLDLLLRQQEVLTTDLVAQRLGSTRWKIAKQLERLRSSGCELEIHPHLGVRLLCTSLQNWPDYLNWRLDAPKPRRIVEVYGRTTSTQDVVRRLIDARGTLANGAIVVADEQTAGRGRLGRKWCSPPGTAVMFSRAGVMPTSSPLPSVDRLMFPAAVAVCRAIEAVTAPNTLNTRIRWPNDILVNGKKIAGILVETIPGSIHTASIIGIGINVTHRPEQLADDGAQIFHRATSLKMCHQLVDRLHVLAETITQIDRALAASDLGPMIDEWRQRNTVSSQRVRLRNDAQLIEGDVVDLDPHDGLIIRTDRGYLRHLPAATTTIVEIKDEV